MSKEAGLACWIIPTEGGNLLVPDNLVAEVVVLEDSDTQQHISWRNRSVPIYQNEINDKITTRVVVLRAVMGYQGLPFIAVAVDGIPHALQVTPDALSEVETPEAQCKVAASYTRVGSLDCVIPDLPKIENLLRERVAA